MLQHQSSGILLAGRNSKKNVCYMFLNWVSFTLNLFGQFKDALSLISSDHRLTIGESICGLNILPQHFQGTNPKPLKQETVVPTATP
jgi:hypothetical protein